MKALPIIGAHWTWSRRWQPATIAAPAGNITGKCLPPTPEDCLAVRLLCDRPEMKGTFRLEIPYLNARPAEEGGRSGRVYTDQNRVILRGNLPSRGLIFEAALAVETDGTRTFRLRCRAFGNLRKPIAGAAGSGTISMCR